VQLFALVGIGGFASVMNFILLTAAASGTNSGVYASSRMFYGLAESKNAPKFLQSLSKRSVPFKAVLTSAIFAIAMTLLLVAIPNADEAYQTVASVTVPCVIITWLMICLTYLKYLKTRPEKHKNSIFPAVGGAVACIGVMIVFVFCFVIAFFEPSTIGGSILGLVILLLIQVCYNIHKKLQTKSGISSEDSETSSE
jgi:D-serine/D-alanine/glycine transporter